jgi:hypothetical protein
VGDRKTVANRNTIAPEPLPLKYPNRLQSRERVDFVMTIAAHIDSEPLFLRYEWGDDYYGKREHVSGVEIPDS